MKGERWRGVAASRGQHGDISPWHQKVDRPTLNGSMDGW